MGNIPKIIHYCWFGKEEFPELIQKCIASWKEKLPDYEIKCWNESNFDVNICRYTEEAFREKKYAFVSDYARLYALYNEGGIYLDTDVKVLKSFDDLLGSKAFACFENKHSVATCILASERGNPLLKKFMDYYVDRKFILEAGKYDLTPNPVAITKICVENGLRLNGTMQKLNDITIYPQDYFCPYNRAKEEITITDNTYSIHYFSGCWISDEKKKIIRKRKEVISKYGKTAGYFYYAACVLRTEGISVFFKEFKHFIKK